MSFIRSVDQCLSLRVCLTPNVSKMALASNCSLMGSWANFLIRMRIEYLQAPFANQAEANSASGFIFGNGDVGGGSESIATYRRGGSSEFADMSNA